MADLPLWEEVSKLNFVNKKIKESLAFDGAFFIAVRALKAPHKLAQSKVKITGGPYQYSTLHPKPCTLRLPTPHPTSNPASSSPTAAAIRSCASASPRRRAVTNHQKCTTIYC